MSQTQRPTLPPTSTELADVARYERECAGEAYPLVQAILKGLIPAPFGAESKGSK